MKTYLRQPQLAKRYAMSVRGFQLAGQEGRIPPPDFYLGQNPMWSVDRIEEFERRSTRRAISSTSASSESDSAENFGAGEANSA
jgi:hypothetical protein